MMGRPTKLTPELQERICMAIRAGNYAEIAARYAGISKSAFYQWMAYGRAGKARRYVEFMEAIKRAEADAEVAMVAIVRTQAPNNWQAAMTWLERKFPQRWARREKADVRISWREQAQKEGVNANELFEQLVKAALDRVGSGGGDAGSVAAATAESDADPTA